MSRFRKFIHALRVSGEALRLTYHEKETMRTHLIAFMQREPLSDPVASEQKKQLWEHTWHMRSLMLLKTVPAACVVFLCIGGSIAFAAQASLPGDVLYPIKVNVTEPLQGATKLSLKAQAQWNTTLVQRRLEEVELLSSQKITPAVNAALLTTAFQKQADAATKNISALAASGDVQTASQAASDYEASLRAHERIVGQLLETASTTKPTSETVALKNFHNTLQEKTVSAAAARNEIEAHVTESVNPHEKQSAIDEKNTALGMIATVVTFIDKNQMNLSPSLIGSATQRLTLARTMISGGDNRLGLEYYGDAFVLYQRATRIAQEANVVMTAAKKFKIKNFERFGGIAPRVQPSNFVTASSSNNVLLAPTTSGDQSSAVAPRDNFQLSSSTSSIRNNGGGQKGRGRAGGDIEQDVNW